ncbi:hypothetical protein [[Leptolyngbya] sp. PCC 7376]|uniref:hypothetical protein n=1 Tax=[Leptolyngbya] sp. PCC 7376 TaxID=111781 RepID=UPI00030DFE8C|nr:hypothetical protein [[Leptolyngbya] sp. PCC 7376]
MGDRRKQERQKSLSPLANRLMRAIIVSRWLMVLVLWMTCGVFAAWTLRVELALWRDYLTWASVRYGLAYNPMAALALVLCVAYTCAVAVWHSEKLLNGWSSREIYRLEKQATKMSENPRHWLWRVLKKIQ